ncbi:MAG: eCIS core domain-containing protein [Arenimonas sp.]
MAFTTASAKNEHGFSHRRYPVSRKSPSSGQGDLGSIQLKSSCACGGGCPRCAMEQEGLQKKEKPSSGAAGATPAAAVNEALNSSGTAMAQGTKQFMENRFNQDFSNVRIHTDGREANSAEMINARAYTKRNDIVFGPGQYQPETSGGKRLLAHELTHVVQQNSGIATKLNSPGHRSALELEADRVADSVVGSDAANPVAVEMKSGPAIQRDVLDESSTDSDQSLLEVLDGDYPQTPMFETEDDVDQADESELEYENAAEVATAVEDVQLDDKKPAKKAAKPKPKPKVISKIEVDLSKQKLVITFDDPDIKPKTSDISSGKGRDKGFEGGNSATDRCASPGTDNSNCTPTGSFTIGKKGGADYENGKGDAMSYYVELEGSGADGRGVGFHNSQIVNGTPMSHGCVRVPEDVAIIINKGVTKSTQVVISGKAKIAADEAAKKAEEKRKADAAKKAKADAAKKEKPKEKKK